VNIFEFNQEVYGESLTLHIHKLIRFDSHFTDLEALKAELLRDKERTQDILRQLIG
jgi:riboflavin kinase / FMN adenylyltransferase